MGATENLLIFKLVTAALLMLQMVTSPKPRIHPSMVRQEVPSKLNLLVVTMHGPYIPVDTPSDQATQPLKLTENGKGLMQHVGELLMMRYENHFRELLTLQEVDRVGRDVYQESEKANVIQVTAVDSEIARSSAAEMIAGIKSQGKDLGQQLKIELSKDNIDKNDFFDPIRARDQVKDFCKEFDRTMSNIIEPEKLEFCILDWIKIRKIFDPSPALNQEKETCKELEKQTNSLKDPKLHSAGFSAKLRKANHEDVYKEFERIQMMFLEECELPDWTKGDNVKAYMAEMRRVAFRRMKHLIGKDVTSWRFFFNKMLRGVFEKFKIPDSGSVTPAQLKGRQARLHIHVVDVHIMSALILWLRVEEELAASYFLDRPDSAFYPHVGDSLLIEIDDELVLKASYIRTVEQMHSRVGWATTSFTKKNKKDFGNDRKGNPFAGYFTNWFNQRLLHNRREWQQCCFVGRCSPTH